MVLLDHIVSGLKKEIATLPDRFYDSFDYTTTGQNYTHPITLGILAKILGLISSIKFVAVDLRLNENGVKFQPDLVALEKIEPIEPLLFLDYESPNSCDSRIPTKDVAAYQEWSNVHTKRIPYFIITTLPEKSVDEWELRYTSTSRYNEMHAGRRQKVCQNPFAYWYSEYRRCIRNTDNIYFINIDGKAVKKITL